MMVHVECDLRFEAVLLGGSAFVYLNSKKMSTLE